MAFLSSFFSKAGQKERLSNVVNYGKLAASKLSFGLIKAPTQNPNYKASGVVENVAQKIADHPYAAAAVGTAATMAAKRAPAVISAARSKITAQKAATQARRTTQSNKPGMVSKVISNAGGMLDKASAPASPVPISSNTGILTKPQTSTTPRAPRRSSSPSKRRGTRGKKKQRRSTRKTTRRTRRKSRKKSYGTAKQYARKGGKSVKYTKNGQPYIILSDGRARFVKGKRK